MRIGAHIRNDQPLENAAKLDADVVQIFLSDPQGWKAPTPHPQAAGLVESELQIFVHSPYVLNVASLNNRIRIPSRKSVLQQSAAAAEIGTTGLVVHAGHVTKSEDPADGVGNWRKLFERQAEHGGFPTRILVENTAGGDGAIARKFDALARLWDAIGEFSDTGDVGFCLDTCHAFAAGEDLGDVVGRVMAITGRIDLVHLNNSRDPFDSARDRHAGIHHGTIEAAALVEVCAAAASPVVVETPDDTQQEDIAYLREQLTS